MAQKVRNKYSKTSPCQRKQIGVLQDLNDEILLLWAPLVSNESDILTSPAANVWVAGAENCTEAYHPPKLLTTKEWR